MSNNYIEIKSEYDFVGLTLKPDCVQITVKPGEFLDSDRLKIDSKYKIFLKTDVNPENQKTTFFLTRFEDPGSKSGPGPNDADFVSPKKFFT